MGCANFCRLILTSTSTVTYHVTIKVYYMYQEKLVINVFYFTIKQTLDLFCISANSASRFPISFLENLKQPHPPATVVL